MDLATTSVLEDCVEQLAVTGGQPVAWIVGIFTVLLVAGGALLLLRSRRGRKALPALLLATLVVVGIGWGPSVVSANATETDCATQSQEVDSATDSTTPVPEDTTDTGGNNGGNNGGDNGGNNGGNNGGDNGGDNGGNNGNGNGNNGNGNENGNNGNENGNNGNDPVTCPEGQVLSNSECVPALVCDLSEGVC